MVPTENFVLFELAESLGKTAAELLSGQPQPLSNMELYLWNRYRLAQARIRQQQQGPRKQAFQG